ncbi:hypothetical protein [Alkalibacter mobilis]|uniref:hypothetical protein n=1 Tax=Alkalibacter mobilis TaxID=2787712 RepID=UPI00189F4E81|nr:hypothetical protein [Alkalibacter mobilis]
MNISLEKTTREELANWSELLEQIFNCYANQVCDSNKCHIGHIKAIFTGVGKDFIKVNIYKRELPADVVYDGVNSYQRIDIIVNSIINNISSETSVKVIEKCSKAIALKNQVAITVKTIDQNKIHDHENQ